MTILLIAVPVYTLAWGAIWLWALIDLGRREDLSSGWRWAWIVALLLFPFCVWMYSVSSSRNRGLRRAALFTILSGLLVGGVGAYRTYQEILSGEFGQRMHHYLLLAAERSGQPLPFPVPLPPPPARPRIALAEPQTEPESEADLGAAKAPEVHAGRRSTIPDPPTPPPGLPLKAFPPELWTPPELAALAFTGARPRWAPLALDGRLASLGEALSEGVRAHAGEEGGGAAWVIWKDRLCLVDREGGTPLPLPAPAGLTPVLYPRDLVWLPPMGALLVLARNGGFYMQPSDDATPARWRHMPAFARRDLRALAFDAATRSLWGLVQDGDQLVAVVRLGVSGEVTGEVPLDPPQPSAARTEPGDLQLRWAAGGLVLLRPDPPRPGGTPGFEVRWIDPVRGTVYRPQPG